MAVHTGSIEAEGPMLSIKLWVPSRVGNALERASQKVPEPVSCRALIDTGAERTFIRTGIAAQLGLQPTDRASTRGAHSVRDNCPVYPIRLLLPDNDVVVDVTQAIEVDLGAGIEVLIGRDILKDALLTYIGPKSLFSIAF